MPEPMADLPAKTVISRRWSIGYDQIDENGRSVHHTVELVGPLMDASRAFQRLQSQSSNSGVTLREI